MNRKRIRITLVNRTYKEIDMSDFTSIQDDTVSYTHLTLPTTPYV